MSAMEYGKRTPNSIETFRFGTFLHDKYLVGMHHSFIKRTVIDKAFRLSYNFCSRLPWTAIK